MIETILNKLEEARELLEYIEDLKEEKHTLQKQLDNVRYDYKRLNDEIIKEDLMIEEYKNKLEQIKKENEELKKELEKLKQDITPKEQKESESLVKQYFEDKD